ncbi:MAG TPA: hypothetical protein VHF69_05950, partial [Candidatus Synoicihabitans sp.]|nr:hypothetical protein [Candidatus Synoicihabitans sp.]
KSGTRVIDKPAPKRASRDVFVYFDNDVKVRAPFDAMSLAHRLGLGPAPTDAAPDPKAIAEEPRTVWPAWQPRAGRGRPSARPPRARPARAPLRRHARGKAPRRRTAVH